MIWLQQALMLGGLALIITAIGYAVAIFVEGLVGRAYRYLGIKEYMEASGFERAIAGIEFELVIKELIKWWVFLVFIIQAASTLGLMEIVRFFSIIMGGYTSLTLAIIYLSGGAILAHYLYRRLEEAGVVGGRLTARVVKWVVIYISLVTAFRLVGFSGIEFLNRIVELLITAFVIAFGLGMGIAFGLGGQDTAKKLIEKYKSSLEKVLE